MACCCTNHMTDKMGVSCLKRCDLPHHKCVHKRDIRPGPVPPRMGWNYAAKDSPEHQLRCGWRPGHILCPVLRRIEAHNCGRCSDCCNGSCPPPRPKPLPFPRCAPPPKTTCPPYPRCNSYPRCHPYPRCYPKCGTTCPSNPNFTVPPCTAPSIRIIRHGGKYQIITKPDNISNHPSGQYPLKYLLNTLGAQYDKGGKKTKFSVEAKYNEYHFDYTSSQTSFVLDFSPPDWAASCQPKG